MKYELVLFAEFYPELLDLTLYKRSKPLTRLYQHLFCQQDLGLFPVLSQHTAILLNNNLYYIVLSYKYKVWCFNSSLIRRMSSSQPKSNFNFDEFNQKYRSIFGKSKDVPSFEFLTWLCGFSEGDGSFIITKRGDLSFVIVQDTRDIQVLYMIQKTLGFGKVIKQGQTTSRFVVQDKAGFYLLCLLFNGNLVTRLKLESFKLFLLAFNKYSSTGRLKFEAINFKSNLVKPSLNDGWLSGFSDAEGCFSAGINATSGYWFLFDLAQKGELDESPLNLLMELFEVGKIYKHSRPGCYYYRVGGLKDTVILFSYFDKHILKSKKLKSYILWKDVHNRLCNKEHLDKTMRFSLKILASKINNTWD